MQVFASHILPGLTAKARAVLLVAAVAISAMLAQSHAARASGPVVPVPAGAGCAQVQTALNSASSMGSASNAAILEFHPGTYAINCTVHLRSNAIIQLDSGAHITATASGFDPPESNPPGVSPNCAGKGGSGAANACQDEGHTILNTAMFRGDSISNFGFQNASPGTNDGNSTIDGGGHFTTGNGSASTPDKLLSISNCSNLVLNGITLRNGGHFEVLTNGCDQVTSDHLDVEAANQRDGWNVISITHLTITNIVDHGNDDGLVFKSDWALGKTLPNGPTTVTHAQLSAGCCNALMYGSETCGNFTDYHFEDITITGSGKSGIGIISSDGANISHLFYDNIRMSGGNPAIITARVWNRKRCGTYEEASGIGSISDVHFTNDTLATSSSTFSPTLYGFNQSGNDISNMTFDNVSITTPHDGGGSPDTVPSAGNDYNPSAIGARPAYGMFVHNVDGLAFRNTSFHGGDSFPAVDVINGSNICLDHVTADASTGGAGDVHFNAVTGYSVTNSMRTGGGALNVTSTGSTAGNPSCPPSPGGTPPPPTTPPPTCTPPAQAAVGQPAGAPSGSGSITFTWPAASADCNGGPVAYYVAMAGSDGTEQVQEVLGTTATFTGLTPGTLYIATVIWFDGTQWTAWSSWGPTTWVPAV